MKQLGWYALQIAIIGGITAFAVWELFPMMESTGDRVGLHVPVLIGFLFAAAATYAINDIGNWLSRRRQRRLAKRDRRIEQR